MSEIPLTNLGGHPVLFVMAAEPEYGPHLKSRFRPLMTGVGPVEAATELTVALADLKGKGGLPHLVVSLGSAGSRSLKQTEVYQASSVSYRDMDASPLGFEKGQTPFLGLPKDVPLPFRVPGIEAATLSTGGAIVSGAAYETITADMVDMETYACLRACQRFAVPLMALRGISDGAQELRQVSDWTQYLHITDEKLAAAVDRLEAAITDGTIAL